MSGDASQTVVGCSMDVGEWAADETSARSMKGAVADGCVTRWPGDEFKLLRRARQLASTFTQSRSRRKTRMRTCL
jgi:hypothetical protein